MQELEIFKNEEFGEIRTVVIENEPWFVGKDIAFVLGYSNSRKAIIDHVDDEDKGVTKCDTLGGSQDLTVINESGLYSLILSSKLPIAKKFKRWVTSEVLPSIRKTGHYGKTPLKDVVSMIRVTQDNMKQQGATAYEIMKQHGIVLPGFVIEPETFSLKDAYDMIDFIYSQPRGKGHKKTTYDDYIAYKANMKMLGVSNYEEQTFSHKSCKTTGSIGAVRQNRTSTRCVSLGLCCQDVDTMDLCDY